MLKPLTRKMQIRAFFAATKQTQQTKPTHTFTLPAQISTATHTNNTRLLTRAHKTAHRFTLKCRLAKPDWMPPRLSPDVDSFIEKVKADAEQQLNSTPNVIKVKRNISYEQIRALSRFNRNTKVCVRQCDKNIGTVVVSCDWYFTEAFRHLNDSKAYLRVDTALATQLADLALREIAMHTRQLPERELEFITQHKEYRHWSIPVFYLLVKLHKQPVVGRPIIAWHSYNLGPASVWLDASLQPLLAMEASVLPDIYSLVSDLEHNKPNTHGAWFLTADAASLYTRMEHNVMLEALSWFLHRHTKLGNFEQYRIAIAIHVLTVLLAHGFLQFNGEVFKQLTGIAMGTPAGPSVANVTLLRWLDLALQTQFGELIIFLRRFIDDLFLIVADLATALTVKAWLASLPSWLKMTVTINFESTEFMDVEVFKPPGHQLTGAVATRIFVKPIAKHLYLPFSSAHPKHTFSGVAVGELIRASRLCSMPSDFVEFRESLFGWLRARGYPTAFLNNWFSRVKYSDRAKYTIRATTTTNTQTNTDNPLTLALPYNATTTLVSWRSTFDRHWHVITQSPIGPAFAQPPLVSWTVGVRLGQLQPNNPNNLNNLIKADHWLHSQGKPQPPGLARALEEATKRAQTQTQSRSR